MPEPARVAPAAPPRVQSRPEPKPEPIAVAAPRAIADLPPVALSLPPDSGLVLVETSNTSAMAPESEPDVPAGPRRARRPRTQLADEPLQIVETRKDQPPAN